MLTACRCEQAGSAHRPLTQGDAQGFALIALVVLAQWSTNTAANLIPAALTFVNAAPRLIDYRIAVRPGRAPSMSLFSAASTSPSRSVTSRPSSRE